MSDADPKILPAVRAQIEQAVEKLNIAATLFRKNGWPENADDISLEVKRLRVWTQRDGRLDYLEK